MPAEHTRRENVWPGADKVTETEPAEGIRDVTPIGPDDTTCETLDADQIEAQTRAAVEGQSDDTLEEKMEEYASAGDLLVRHHNYMAACFSALITDLDRVSSKLDLLKEIAANAKVTVPDYQILEDFDLFGDIGEVMQTPLVIGGVAGGLAGTYAAWKEFGRASKIVASAQAAKAPAKSVSSLRWTKWGKGLGVAGAVVGVVGGGIGVYSTIKNAQLKREFLVDAVTNLELWYRATKCSYDEICEGAYQIQEELYSLMQLTGKETIDEMVEVLGEQVQSAGHVQASVKSAIRMFCATSPLSVAQVVQFTGLSAGVVNKIKTAIDNNSDICNRV